MRGHSDLIRTHLLTWQWPLSVCTVSPDLMATPSYGNRTVDCLTTYQLFPRKQLQVSPGAGRLVAHTSELQDNPSRNGGETCYIRHLRFLRPPCATLHLLFAGSPTPPLLPAGGTELLANLEHSGGCRRQATPFTYACSTCAMCQFGDSSRRHCKSSLNLLSEGSGLELGCQLSALSSANVQYLQDNQS